MPKSSRSEELCKQAGKLTCSWDRLAGQPGSEGLLGKGDQSETQGEDSEPLRLSEAVKGWVEEDKDGCHLHLE